MHEHLPNCVVFIGRSNQPSTGVAATPTHGQCSIRIIHKCVATKLSPHWSVVCRCLGYSPDCFRRASDKKSVIAVMEHWINDGDRMGRPKTWSMFAEEILSNINPTVAREICNSLQREGVHIGEL